MTGLRTGNKNKPKPELANTGWNLTYNLKVVRGLHIAKTLNLNC
jgi:hypothetical protein